MNPLPKFSLFHDYLILRFSLVIDLLHFSPVDPKGGKDDVKLKGISSESEWSEKKVGKKKIYGGRIFIDVK